MPNLWKTTAIGTCSQLFVVFIWSKTTQVYRSMIEICGQMCISGTRLLLPWQTLWNIWMWHKSYWVVCQWSFQWITYTVVIHWIIWPYIPWLEISVMHILFHVSNAEKPINICWYFIANASFVCFKMSHYGQFIISFFCKLAFKNAQNVACKAFLSCCPGLYGKCLTVPNFALSICIFIAWIQYTHIYQIYNYTCSSCI